MKFAALWVVCASLFATVEEEQLKQEVLTQLPYLEGWCTKEKASQFIDLVLAEKPLLWVEIGVFGGSSLFPVVSAFKFLGEGTAVAIDAWDKIECIKDYDPVKDKADLRWWGNLNLNQIYASFLRMLQTNRLDPFCKVIRATSEQAASEVGEIDVLHLDGNHSEAASLRDVELYLPKVRPGGYIWMNDSLWEKRQPAVERLLQECDVVKLIDNGNCILFRKR